MTEADEFPGFRVVIYACKQTSSSAVPQFHSNVPAALLWRPSRHSHLRPSSGCHANPLQTCLWPNTASSLAAVVTRGYFKCSHSSLPPTLSFLLASPAPPSPMLSPLIPGTIDASSVSPPAPLASSAAEPHTVPMSPDSPLLPYHEMRPRHAAMQRAACVFKRRESIMCNGEEIRHGGASERERESG